MQIELTDRQREILHASMELITQNGIQGLTIKNIAQKMNFTEAAVYRHYSNKIQILNGILDFFRNNTRQIFATEIPNVSSIKQIEMLFKKHFMAFAQRPSLVAVIFSEEIFRNETELLDKVRLIMQENALFIQKIIENGQKNDEIRNDVNPEYLTTIIMGTLRLFVKQWQLADYGFQIEKKGNELINTIKLLIMN